MSIVTRSGSNQPAGRGYYYHRDHRWDASSHAARLTSPRVEDSAFEQKLVGGFFGGPIVHDHAFFFGSAEYTMQDTENIVTSPVLQLFRPGVHPRQPVYSRQGQLMDRTDLVFNPSNMLTIRHRWQRGKVNGMIAPGASDVGLNAPERAFDVVTPNQDVAVQHNLSVGPSTINEARLQWARTGFDRDASSYCPGCPDIQRPSIRLGKSLSVPNGVTETQWQFADTITHVLRSAVGEHTLKAGIDVNVIGTEWRGLTDRDGTFVFNTDAPFDPGGPDPIQWTG
jgi:hypothetical protein